MTDQYVLPTANIEWQHGTPFSKDFEDIYWSRDTGLDEKSHVFIEPAGFESRWSRLANDDYFVVAELGFGFGLNFLLTVATWRRLRPRGVLHYVSFENQPVSAAQIERLTSLLPDLPVAELAANYPAPIRGQHVRWFNNRIRLLLIFDDAARALRGFSGRVDAWYLDGFSPGCNPGLWNQRALGPVFGLSRPGATLSTYSVAGTVRRCLQNAGFRIERRGGFGRKREMLVALREGDWHPASRPAGNVTIIGRGVAGGYLAEALERRAIETVIIAKDAGTSGQIRQLAVYPSLAIRAESRYRFSISAFEYTRHQNQHFHQVGVRIELKDAERPRWVSISHQLPYELVHLDGNELVFPHGGWLDASQVAPTGIPRLETTTGKISQSGGQWHISDMDGHALYQSNSVFLAMGAADLPVPHRFELDMIPGLALTVVDIGGVSEPVMTGRQTRFPIKDGVRTISGLYDRELIKPDAKHISTLLSGIMPTPRVMSAHLGIRAATRDRFPIAGAMPDWLKETDPPGTIPGDLDGMFVITGLGSHGGNHARLLAEYLVSLYTGEPLPIDKSVQAALAPVRFVARDAGRATRTRER